VRICTVSAIAFYLFLRFQVQREPWPTFDVTMDWQDIKLLRSQKDPKVALKYPAQLKLIKTDFQKHGLDLKAWTHSGRKAGVQHGERLDIPEMQIRQLGHWDSSRMAQHYSTGVAKQAARMLAGHGPDPR
jgi:hypothetical protein